LNGIQSDWFEEKYSLADYPAGETILVRIAFISDTNSIGEGFYIDNVNIEYITAVSEGDALSGDLSALGFSVFPNPFYKNLVIKYQIPSTKFQTNSKSQAALKIYDAAGRLVKQFSHLTIQPINQIIWDGADEIGRLVPAGVYFVALESGDFKQLKKVVLLK
jgi:hypothetical protein